MKIKISSDSTCDLTKEIIEQLDISIVPLLVSKGEDMLRDGIDITAGDVIDFMVSGAGLCTTSAVSIGEYEDVFKGYLENYDAVIHLNISHKFSSCYQNAKLAAASLKNVYIVDTMNLSTGSGHLVIDAALLARSGMEPAMIAATIAGKTDKVEASFVIDTLKYLHKGGRCSAVAALGANLLKLKPCIEVVDGAMGVGKKYRGNVDKCILQYVEDKLKDRTDLDLRRIFITCTVDTPDEVIESVKEKILSLQPFEQVLVSYAGCTITSHCGTRTLGILYNRK